MNRSNSDAPAAAGTLVATRQVGRGVAVSAPAKAHGGDQLLLASFHRKPHGAGLLSASRQF